MLSVLVVAGLSGQAPSALALPLPGSDPAGWITTAADPAYVQQTIDRYRYKLDAQFNERLKYVGSDGMLRVMAVTSSRGADVQSFVADSTTAHRWYENWDGFYALVTPDQIANLLASPYVLNVEPDYAIDQKLSSSAIDVRARTASGAPSVVPDGTQQGTVSAASPSLTYSGSAPAYPVLSINGLLGIGGVRPLCQAPSCHSFKLHVTDSGTLTVGARIASANYIAIEVVKPDGTSIYSEDATGSASATFQKTPPGSYVVNTWVNSVGTSAPFTGSATLQIPGSSAPDGLWGFTQTEGTGALFAADPKLSVAAATGKGVTAAVIDGGIDKTHPDFGGFSCTPEPYQACESRVKEAVTLSQVVNLAALEHGSSMPTTEFASGHGTHVAGIVAGNGYVARRTAGSNSNSAKVTGSPGIPIGVAPEASLVSIKNGETLSAGLSSFAMDWLASNAQRLGVRTVNNSWGCSGGCAATSSTAAAAKALYLKGVLVVFAAGNDAGTNNGSKFSGDSQGPYGLSVANYDDVSHRLASSSSRGLGTARCRTRRRGRPRASPPPDTAARTSPPPEPTSGQPGP